MTLPPVLEAFDPRGPVCDGAVRARPSAGAMAIVRSVAGAAPPPVSGVQTGTAGRRFSSIPGVVEAAE